MGKDANTMQRVQKVSAVIEVIGWVLAVSALTYFFFGPLNHAIFFAVLWVGNRIQALSLKFSLSLIQRFNILDPDRANHKF